jgi:hypothetical protein
MSRNIDAVMTVAFAVGLLFCSCATRSEAPKQNTPEEIAAAKLVLEELKDTLGDAYATGLAHFEMGALNEGCAVLLVHVNNEPINAAFWTHEERVYVVNPAARRMNGTLSNAPPTINEEQVRAVVH